MMEPRDISYLNTPLDFTMRYGTVPDRLEELANEHGDKEIYVFLSPDGTRESIAANELYSKAKTTARLLLKLGVKRGDVVVSCMPNTLDSLICTFGIICAGGIALNTNLSKADGSDVASVIAKTKAIGLFLDPGKGNADLKACLNFIKHVQGDGTASGQTVPSLRFVLSTVAIDDINILSYKNNNIDVPDTPLPRNDPEDDAIIFCTSGSTGVSKFVPHSHHQVLLIGYQLEETALFGPDDVIYCERRIAWIGGFPFIYLQNGAKTVTKTAPFPTLREHCLFTAKVIDDERCNIACLLPATIIGISDIWDEKGCPKTTLKNIHVGGLPVADICMDAIGRYTSTVTHVYGSSEGAYFTSNIIRDKSEYTSYSTGTPLRGVEVKVVDEDGKVVPRGVTGEVHIRSPTMFYRYYNDVDGQTQKVLSQARWMDTDDIGVIGADGKLTVAGRKSDIIMQGGRYFIPSEVEAFIKTHPDVLDAVAVPIPDKAKFVLVCACVIVKADRKLSANDIKEHLEIGFLPSSGEAFSISRPEHVLIYKDYPRTYTGKPNKSRLTEDAIARVSRGEWDLTH